MYMECLHSMLYDSFMVSWCHTPHGWVIGIETVQVTSSHSQPHYSNLTKIIHQVLFGTNPSSDVTPDEGLVPKINVVSAVFCCYARLLINGPVNLLLVFYFKKLMLTVLCCYDAVWDLYHIDRQTNRHTPDEGITRNIVLCYYNAVEKICLLVYERDSVNRHLALITFLKKTTAIITC